MLHDHAKMTSTTTGMGTLTLGSAVSGFLSFDAAGVQDGELVVYAIRDGSNSEIGYGTYTASGTTLSRDHIWSTTRSFGLAINCSGNEVVFLEPGSRLMNCIDPYYLHHRSEGFQSVDDDEYDLDTSADYTQVSPTGTPNWTIANHSLNANFSGIAASDVCAFLKPVTLLDGDWLETSLRYVTQSVNYTFMGLVIADGATTTSNALVVCAFLGSGTAGKLDVRYDKGTITNLSSSGSDTSIAAVPGALRLQLKRTNSTTYSYLLAPENGGVFGAFDSSTFDPGFTPAYAGLCVSNWGSIKPAIASFDYFRHYPS
jgi:hypothetical protein